MVLFTDQIFKNSFWQRAWPNICFKTRSQVFQTFVVWAFEALRENEKLDRGFEKFGQVLKRLVRVIKEHGHMFKL